MSKVCRSCRQLKPIDDFGILSSSPDGRNKVCRPCRRVYDKRFNSKPHRREAIKANSTSRRIHVAEKVWNYLLENPCVVCGETDPVVLEFDHLGDKAENISVLRGSSSWSRVQKEIVKCQVLCANCHKRKTSEDFGWYKNIASVTQG